MKSKSIQELVRKNIRELKPYSSARDEFQGTASVYLDANENPFNSLYNRYPDPHQTELKKKIGAIKNIAPQNIFLGNGSDEPIDLLIRAFCIPDKDNILILEPTYGMYSVSAGINSVEIKKVRLTPDFDIDSEATERAWNENTKILFLCSPNNPSGNLVSGDKILRLLDLFSGIVVVDEAYIDFTATAGFIPLIDRYPNLVVLQTLSKAWGLAGIRLGMCFGNTELIGILDRIKPPYNISVLTQAAALERLDHEEKKNQWVKIIIEQRGLLKQSLSRLEIVEHIYPTDANFFLVKVKGAKKIYSQLVERGIIVRDRSTVVLCDECLRITVGTQEENKLLTEALNEL